MRATEFLTEHTASDGSKLIAKMGSLWLWQVPERTYLPVYERDKAEKFNPALPVPPGAPIIYYVSDQVTYMSVDNGGYAKTPLTPDLAVKNYAHNYRFFTVEGDELISLAGTKEISPGILKKLVKLTGAQHAPTLSPDDVKHHVLHGGAVTHKKLKQQEYALSPLSNGSPVSKVPKNLLWTVGIRIRVDDPREQDWDTRWDIDSPIAGTYAFVSKDNRIVRLHYPQNKAHAAIKELRELVAREGLTLGVDLPDAPAPAVGKAKVVKPASNMHKMLAYIAEHPGATRSDWYVKHLGNSAQGMVGWTDDKAQDGGAASMGWIRNEATGGKYSLHITPVGKLVLARLNGGHPVTHTKQV